MVGADLSVPGHPDIFVIGDTARGDGSTAGAPGIAPAAKQMGRYVGRLIRRGSHGQLTTAVSLPPCGDLATIGRHAAVVKLGRLQLTGFLGWLFWSVVHIYFLIGLRDRFIVAFTWLWDYVTFQRGARLITEVPPQQQPDASEPAEPVVALVLPVAAGVVVLHVHRGDVLRVLEAELGRHAALHREAVLARQDLVVELERQLRLRMQRRRHVDGVGIALGASEPDVFGAVSAPIRLRNSLKPHALP